MLTISPNDTPQPLFHHYMLSSIAPRPIAFASTIDENGQPNLAPFSFFNAFGSNPPIVIFSPARSGREGTTKHSYNNVKKVPEAVINVVSYSMVQQASLASAEYPKDVNEFVKAGFTAIPSVKVRPFRVKESPVQIECKVLEVKEMGDKGGAANLIICEIALIHVSRDVLDSENKIDPNKIDLVGRMGGNWYCRASGANLFELAQPGRNLGIGIDALPERIKNSKILTGNDLGKLGNVTHLPTESELKDYKPNRKYDNEEDIYTEAKKLLDTGRSEDALKFLMANLLK